MVPGQGRERIPPGVAPPCRCGTSGLFPRASDLAFLWLLSGFFPQTRNPLGAGYVSPRLLGEEVTEPANVSETPAASPAAASSSSSAGSPASKTADLSNPQAAVRAFAATGHDMDKVVAVASRAESVDFESFVHAIAKAGDVSMKEVYDKLRFACDYNGDISSEEDGDVGAAGPVEAEPETELEDTTAEEIVGSEPDERNRLINHSGGGDDEVAKVAPGEGKSGLECVQKLEKATEPFTGSLAPKHMTRGPPMDAERADVLPVLDRPATTSGGGVELTAVANKAKQVIFTQATKTRC